MLLKKLLEVLVFLQLFCQWFVSPIQMKINLWYIHTSDNLAFQHNDLYVKSWGEGK